MTATLFGRNVRMLLISAAALGVLPISFGTLQAQSRSAISLSEVYRLVSAAPRVTAATALAEAARARVPSAKLPPDPELQLGFMNRELPSLAPMDPLGMTQIQLMQMLPLGGKLRLAGRVAADNADAADARATDVRWDVRARAAMQFYDLYAAEARLNIARETKRLVQDIATISRTMYSVGEARQADVLRAQVEIARMTEDITRMESMRSSMAAKLLATLDLPLTALPQSAQQPALPDTLPPLEALVSEAELRRPMVIAGEKDLASAEAGERLARKELWPDLQVGLQYGWRSGEMGTEKMGSLMLGASVPIHARSRQLRMRDEAAAMRRMSAADLAAMRAETRGRMSELYADYMRARNLRSLYRTTVLPQAEATVTSSLAAYRVGDVNLMTLLDNQMTVNRYRQELITLDAEEGKAIAEMEMLLGRELFDPDSATRTAP
jgi:cobalt-zinc-cadmium efflux system outer membrane protein